jgi:ATP-dependent exoDNAse (exonuclease V) beta subunit
MSQPPVRNEVVLASAGSGKTFRLSDRIIKLLANDAKPEQIVALTFTRAAAAEFIAKTLSKLAEAAGSEEAAQELNMRLKLDAGQGAAYYRSLLRATLLSMHRMTLGTLDSFFARLVVNNPAEVGLDGGQVSNIGETEKPLIRQQVIAQLLSELDGEELAQVWQELRDLNQGKDTAMPLQILDDRIEGLHDLLTLAPEAKLWGEIAQIWGELPSYFQPPSDAMVELAATTVNNWASTETFHGTFRNSLITFAEFAKKTTNTSELKEAQWNLIDDRLREIVLGKDGKEALVRYPSGDKGKDIRFPSGVCDALRVLARKVYARAVTKKLAETRALHRLLTRYEEIYHRTVRQRGQLTFSDNVTLLLAAEKTGTKLNIDYRLDCQVKHWLFDEFQDTSTRQWKVIENNLRELKRATEENPEEWRSTFFVGDPKQSLYGWRGGNPELLKMINADAFYTQGNDPDSRMDFTRRCSQPVVELVNELLGNLNNFGMGFSPGAADQWAKAFVRHESRAKNKELGEALWVRLSPDSPAGSQNAEPNGLLNDEDKENEDIKVQARWIGAHLRHTELLDGRLLKPGITCAILVSTNKQAAKITETLRKMGIEAADEANAEIALDNPFTSGLVALIANTAHPSDRYYEGLAGMAPASRAYVDQHGGWESARLRIAQLFHSSGADSVVLDFLQSTKLDGKDNGHAFLRKRAQQLLGLAVNFDQDYPRDLAAFAGYLTQSTLRDVADPRAVQVLTIHRSKGLQYTAVYLPGLNSNQRKIAEVRFDDPMMKVDSQTFDLKWILCRPKSQVAQRDPQQLALALDQETAASAYENLCKLYVGMTRAVRQLVLVSNKLSAKAEEKIANAEDASGKYDYAQLAEAVLGRSGQQAQALNLPRACASEIVWSRGSRDWVASTVAPANTSTPAPLRSLKAMTPVVRVPNLKPSKSSLDFVAKWKPQTGESKGREFGTCVHTLFQHLAWDKETFLRKIAEVPGGTDAADHAKAAGIVRQCIESPRVAELLFSHPPEALLWLERQAVLMHEGKIINAVFDRVHVIPGRDAVVIDYKTNDCSLEHLKEMYAGQMGLYRIAVAKLCGLSPEKVRCVLVHVRLGALVEC